MTDIVQLTDEQREAIAAAEAERAIAPAMTTPEWYVLRMQEIADAEKRVKEHAKMILAALQRQRSGLVMRFGSEVKEEIDAMLRQQGGRKKSVTLHTGRAGYRSRKAGIVVTDKDALIPWCVENCPEALDTSIGRKTPITEHIAATGEIPPGVTPIPAGDVFYPAVTLAAALPAGEEDNDD